MVNDTIVKAESVVYVKKTRLVLRGVGHVFCLWRVVRAFDLVEQSRPKHAADLLPIRALPVNFLGLNV